jgi:hypothetical protein
MMDKAYELGEAHGLLARTFPELTFREFTLELRRRRWISASEKWPFALRRGAQYGYVVDRGKVHEWFFGQPYTQQQAHLTSKGLQKCADIFGELT